MKNIIGIMHSALFFLLKIAAAATFCLVFSFAFVYPLWLFAVKKPDAFSAAVFILCLIAVSAAVILKIKSGKKK